MAISTSMDNSLLVTGQDAVYQAAANKKAQTAGKQTTDRGTLITKSNTEFDKNSFLKILSAQLSNQDPTTNQDSTAYVTQMAQFTSMEQMANLNDTMTTYSYQGLIGKGVTVDVSDSNGNQYTGIVRGVSKQNSNWYLSVEVNENGKNVYKVFDASKLVSVIGTSDNTNSNMLTNSDFIAASNLAKDENNKVVILNTDANGNKTIVKGTVKSAFLDNGIVKVRVSTFDSDGNESTTTTDYPYSYIVKAGNLTTDDMNVTVADYEDSSDTSSTSTDPTKDPNSKSYDKQAAIENLANSTTEVKGSSSNVSADSIEEEYKKLQNIING